MLFLTSNVACPWSFLSAIYLTEKYFMYPKRKFYVEVKTYYMYNKEFRSNYFVLSNYVLAFKYF